MSRSLRSKVIRLAYTRPELQKDLLPLLQAHEDKVAVNLTTQDAGDFLQGMKAYAEIHRRKGDLLTWNTGTNAQVDDWLQQIIGTRARLDRMGNVPVSWSLGTTVSGVIQSDPRRGSLYLKLDNFPGAFFDPDAAVKGVIQYAAQRGAEGPSSRGRGRGQGRGKVLRRRPGRERVRVVAATWTTTAVELPMNDGPP